MILLVFPFILTENFSSPLQRYYKKNELDIKMYTIIFHISLKDTGTL